MALRHYISSELLDLSTIKEIVEENKKLSLSEEAILNIKKSNEYLWIAFFAKLFQVIFPQKFLKKPQTLYHF